MIDLKIKKHVIKTVIIKGVWYKVKNARDNSTQLAQRDRSRSTLLPPAGMWGRLRLNVEW